MTSNGRSRIDRAIDELEALEADGAHQVRPIIERLIAVRRGYCESLESCRHCDVPCGALAQAEGHADATASGWRRFTRPFRRPERPCRQRSGRPPG